MHGDRSRKKLGNPARISNSCVVLTFSRHFMNNHYATRNCKKRFELENNQIEVTNIMCKQFDLNQNHKHKIEAKQHPTQLIDKQLALTLP
jgi:hypothetical protein